MSHWAKDAVFYHIYPLGFCGAPRNNDFSSAPSERLNKIEDWIEHIKSLRVNAVYLGPVFESVSHGYDTIDYYWVDRRLGTNDTLRELIETLHDNGIKVVLDAVFHHVGREFWAFKDVLSNHGASQYCSWFSGLDFSKKSPYGDPFSYDGWNGCFNLVKLDLSQPALCQHLFGAVESWIRDLGIDGLRLDAADYMDIGFLKQLSGFCKSIIPDFWLMGEVIHGDYRKWLNEGGLDSVTNYECYKGLFSSHNDKNYFEIAYSLNRQFAQRGLYNGCYLYNFADNHDVDRVASSLKDGAHLYNLYGLLFTMPGIPSLYYGSEWGIEGRKINGDDNALRPSLELSSVSGVTRHPDLLDFIRRLSSIRADMTALRYGGYKQLLVQSQQFAFRRDSDDESVVVAVNSDGKEVKADISLGKNSCGVLRDLLSADEEFAVSDGKASVKMRPYSVRVMRLYR